MSLLLCVIMCYFWWRRKNFFLQFLWNLCLAICILIAQKNVLETKDIFNILKMLCATRNVLFQKCIGVWINCKNLFYDTNYTEGEVFNDECSKRCINFHTIYWKEMRFLGMHFYRLGKKTAIHCLNFEIFKNLLY